MIAIKKMNKLNNKRGHNEKFAYEHHPWPTAAMCGPANSLFNSNQFNSIQFNSNI